MAVECKLCGERILSRAEFLIVDDPNLGKMYVHRDCFTSNEKSLKEKKNLSQLKGDEKDNLVGVGVTYKENVESYGLETYKSNARRYAKVALVIVGLSALSAALLRAFGSYGYESYSPLMLIVTTVFIISLLISPFALWSLISSAVMFLQMRKIEKDIKS